MAISIPTFLLIFLHRWIPDSPRWLLKRGHIKEVKDILIESAEMNGKAHVIPCDLENQLQKQAAAWYVYSLSKCCKFCIQFFFIFPSI